MHKESLTKDTESVLHALGSSGIAKDFYLAGGTALALHLGHRLSIDLDWFSETFNYNFAFREKLRKIGELTIDDEMEDTFNGSLNNVKISFFRYPYPLISPKVKYNEDIYLAGIPDIAAMKMDAIANRGSYKDFVDIYFILKIYSLKDVLDFVHKRFVGINYNEAHLLKALIYFEDVKESVKPKMINRVEWEEITSEIKKKVKEYTDNI